MVGVQDTRDCFQPKVVPGPWDRGRNSLYNCLQLDLSHFISLLYYSCVCLLCTIDRMLSEMFIMNNTYFRR